MPKLYSKDEIDHIEDQSEEESSNLFFYYLVLFILIGAVIGCSAFLLIRFAPELRRIGTVNNIIKDRERLLHITGHNHTHTHIHTCTPKITCNLNSSQSVGAYAFKSIFNEAGSTTIYGDAVINSADGLVGLLPPLVTGNIYLPPNSTVSTTLQDVNNYTTCVTHQRCTDYSRDPFFFQKPIEPGVYCRHTITTDYTLIGKWDVVLNGRNMTNPVWIFILDFSMVMDPFSSIKVVNTNYKFNNVWYFKKGYVYISKNSYFQGSIIAQQNVIMEQNTTVTGKVFSLTGYIATYNSSINIDGGFGPKNCSQ